MKIIERIAAKMGYSKGSPIIPASYTGQALGVFPERSYRQLIEGYKGWVYTTVDRIAKTVAMLPLKLYVYRKNNKVISLSLATKMELSSMSTRIEKTQYLKNLSIEKEEVLTHPFLDLMQKPNLIQTRFNFWYAIMLRLELTGMCGLYMVPNKLGIPQEMWALPMTKYGELRPIADTKTVISGYKYQDGDILQNFTLKEILYLRYENPSSPFQGMSPLMAQVYPYDIDLYLGQQQAALFRNKGIPGLALTTDQNLTKTQVADIKKQLDEGYAGAIKAGKPLITHSGLKGDSSLAQTGRDFMIGQVAKYAKDKLITSYDVPPAKITGDAVNRSVMEVLDKTYAQECIKPKAMMIEEMFETFVLPLYDENLTLDFELPEHRDRAIEIQERVSNLGNYYTTINEEREKEGKPKVAWGDKPWMPLMIVQPGTLSEQPEGVRAVKQLKNDNTNDIQWKAFAKRTEAWEKLVASTMEDYWAGQLKAVLSRLKDTGKALVGMYAGWSRKKVQQHIAQKDTISDVNIDKKKEAKKLDELMTPVVLSIMNNAGQYRMDEIDEATGGKAVLKQFEFNINDPAVKEWLGTRMDLFSKEVTDTTFDEIKAVLREGFSEGAPVTVISDTLRDKFKSWDKYRALMIARTETIASANKADLLGVEQTGLEDDLLKHWLSSRDANTRETHFAAEVQYADGIPIKEDFEVGGESLPAPGNGQIAENNINCRCSLTYSKA